MLGFNILLMLIFGGIFLVIGFFILQSLDD